MYEIMKRFMKRIQSNRRNAYDFVRCSPACQAKRAGPTHRRSLAALRAAADPGGHHRRVQVRPHVRHPDRLPQLQSGPGHHRQPVGGLEVVRALLPGAQLRPDAVEHREAEPVFPFVGLPGADHPEPGPQPAAVPEAQAHRAWSSAVCCASSCPPRAA